MKDNFVETVNSCHYLLDISCIEITRLVWVSPNGKIQSRETSCPRKSLIMLGSSEVPEIRIIVSVNPWTNAKT